MVRFYDVFLVFEMSARQTPQNVCNRNYTSLLCAIALRATEWTRVKGVMARWSYPFMKGICKK